MIIDDLHIKNFKGFTDLHLHFNDQFTVIVGNNGLGKTSILDALASIASVYLAPLGGGRKYQRPINKAEVRVVATTPDTFEPQLPCTIEASNADMTWTRTISTRNFNNSLGKNNPMSSKGEKDFNAISKGAPVILPVFAYHGTGRLWAEYDERVDYAKQGSRTEGYDYCMSAKSSSKAFRSWYKTLEKNSDKKDSEIRQRLQLFRQVVASCVDDWDDFYYDFAEDDIIGICHKQDSDIRLPYRMMSDGYRNMIGMVADIAYRCIRLNPHLGADAIKETTGLVLIDELDLHLHPTWQRNIVRELTTAFPKIQFVVTTHSPFILQSASTAQVINLDNEPLQDDPRNASLELNARYMGVQSVNGTHFTEKEQAAADFYTLLSQDDEHLDKEQVEKAFETLAINYSDDAAYVALLKAEKAARLATPK